MNYKHPKGSILLTALILLIGILATIFLAKNDAISYTQKANAAYHAYLKEKIALVNLHRQDKNQQCITQQKEIIEIKLNKLDYLFHCQKLTFFKHKVNSKKYVSLNKFSDELDLKNYQHLIYKINSLLELPDTSINEPKIVLAQNAIDETLTKNFYGIILTEHLFDISGRTKIYGKLYSTFDNEREERNLTYKKEVLEKLEQATTHWQYLPHSTRIKAHENIPSR